MVKMVQPTTNRTMDKVDFVNVNRNNTELMGTEMVLVAGKDLHEYQYMKC